MSEPEETPRFVWSRVEHRGVTWHLVPEANAKYPLGYSVAIVLRHFGVHARDPKWKAIVHYGGRNYWVLAGTPLRLRRLVEDYLSRRCNDWDGHITNSAYERSPCPAT